MNIDSVLKTGNFSREQHQYYVNALIHITERLEKLAVLESQVQTKTDDAAEADHA